MLLRPITRELFLDWLTLRDKLFPDLDPSFQGEEMNLIMEANDAHAFLCVSDEGQTAGILEVSLRSMVDGCLHPPVGYIDALYLEPAFRGRGNGRQVVEMAAEWFRRQGCAEMATDADATNVAAQRFFSVIGFEETYRIVQFKRSLSGLGRPPEDVLE